MSIDTLHSKDTSVQDNGILNGLTNIEISNQGKIDENREKGSNSIYIFF